MVFYTYLCLASCLSAWLLDGSISLRVHCLNSDVWEDLLWYGAMSCFLFCLQICCCLLGLFLHDWLSGWGFRLMVLTFWLLACTSAWSWENIYAFISTWFFTFWVKPELGLLISDRLQPDSSPIKPTLHFCSPFLLVSLLCTYDFLCYANRILGFEFLLGPTGVNG